MIALDVTLANLYRQYYRCRRNKRNTVNALRFEAEQEKNLLALREALLDRSYRPTRSVCFFATRPKLREIFAADFQDRVVHHLLVDYLERIWEPVFIHDSYACRRRKGVHAGVARLQRFLHQVTSNGTRPAWYLQLDIENYFMRIDKGVLFRLLAARLHDEGAVWLTRLLVYHDCTQDYIFRGRPGLAEKIPSHKTLFGAPADTGLPIGNLNSQFFANVYLNGLDQFVKHTLKCRHYLRYCDDFVLLSREPAELMAWRQRIEDYLCDELALALNARERLAPVANGIDFLGYIVRRDYKLVRRRVVHHLREKLKGYEARLVDARGASRCYHFDRETLDTLAATLASYLGHFKSAQCWNLWQALWREFDFLSRYFEFDAARWKLVRKYGVPAGLRRTRQQYRYFRWRFPDCALFFPVGRFVECYDYAAPHWVEGLGLKRLRRNRRGASYGFPLRQSGRHLQSLLERGYHVLLIEQCRHARGGIRERVAAARYEPLGATQRDLGALAADTPVGNSFGVGPLPQAVSGRGLPRHRRGPVLAPGQGA